MVQRHSRIRVFWHSQHRLIKIELEADFYLIQQQHSQVHLHQHHLEHQLYLVRKFRLIKIVISRFEIATPSASQSSASGTIHKFDAVAGVDKITKNNVQTQIRTKLFNLCAMPAYEKKSMEVSSMKDYLIKYIFIFFRNFEWKIMLIIENLHRQQQVYFHQQHLQHLYLVEHQQSQIVSFREK